VDGNTSHVTSLFLSAEEQAASGDYTWLVIAASCVGAILIFGAIMATVYYKRQKRGQQLLKDNTTQVKETGSGQIFENPVYQATV